MLNHSSSNLFTSADTAFRLGTNTLLLKGFIAPYQSTLITALTQVTQQAPFRHMVTRGGFKMSVAMSNCGGYGWISDRKGYRYSALDPINEKPWPNMPASFLELASNAATAAGFHNFMPDACLINRYEIGAKMALHQDQDEQNFTQPIVSVSLGIPATFLLGGSNRADKTERVLLEHGDVLVWGGVDRLRFHGVLPIKKPQNYLYGNQSMEFNNHRINLTFRRAY